MLRNISCVCMKYALTDCQTRRKQSSDEEEVPRGYSSW